MIYIFDLDDTLLNSIKLKKTLANIMHFTSDEFIASRKRYFANRNSLYNPLEHIKIICKKGEISIKQRDEFLRDVRKMVENINTFIFPEAKEILKKLKYRGNYLILLTHGDLMWQKLKFKNLTIKKFFNKIIVTDKNKIDKLRCLNNTKEKIVIINDNAKENLLIKKYFPQAKIFLIYGPHAQNIEHREKLYKLKDILKIYDNKKEKN